MLAGYFDFSQQIQDKKILKQLVDPQKYSCGRKINYYYDKNLYLAHSVFFTEFTKGEKFPVENKYDELVCFVDGIIFNYRKIRKELESKGYRFETSGKYEIIPYLYKEYGNDCFGYLDGKFLIAIWDRKTKKLCIASDRNASKPVYYTKAGAALIFSSKIKGILNTGLAAALQLLFPPPGLRQ